MNRKLKKVILLIATAGVLAGFMAACGDDSKEEVVKATQESESGNDKGSISDKKQGKDGSGSFSDVMWTSSDERISMELPDDTWKAETDTEMSMTLRSEAGTVNIVRYEGADMIEMMVPTTKEEYQSMVSGGSGDTAVEVVEFNYKGESDKTVYQGVMEYKNEENPYHYLIHYGVYDSEGGYTATGIVNSSEKDIMETVKTAIYSMRVAQ